MGWTVKYNAGSTPQTADPVWTRVVSGTPAIEAALDGIFRGRNAAASGSMEYSRTHTAVTAVTLLFRVRVTPPTVGTSTQYDVLFSTSGGSNNPGSMRWVNSAGTIQIVLQGADPITSVTVTDYHIYRLTARLTGGTSYALALYIDEELPALATVASASIAAHLDEVLFDGKNASAADPLDMSWDYFYYKLGRAVPPGGDLPAEVGTDECADDGILNPIEPCIAPGILPVIG